MDAGRECVAVVNLSPGTYADPTWTAMGRITGVKRPQTRSTNERMFRGAQNKKTVLGYKQYGFEFEYVAKSPGLTDTVLAALQTSFDNGSHLDVAFLDGPAVEGAKGVRGPFAVSDFTRNEPDEDGVTYSVVLVEVEAEQSGTLWEADEYTVPAEA